MSRKASLALILLLLSSSWSLQALAIKNDRKFNRSDAIILAPSHWGEVKFVRPNPSPGHGNGYDADNKPYLGPNFVYKKGFSVLSTDPASYFLNFPTMGADGLYFDLYIQGSGVKELIWDPVTHEGITATVKLADSQESHWTYAPWWEEKEVIKRDDVTFVRVTLTGPEAFYQRHNSYPNRIIVPRLPQIFELVGRDNNGEDIIKYGFVLQKWFVNRVHGTRTRFLQETWCNRLGYRLSRIRDLTNAICVHRAGYTPVKCESGLGAMPSSNKEELDRRIGVSMLSEWGNLDGYDHEYDGKGYYYPYVWVSDYHSDIRDFWGTSKYSYQVETNSRIGRINDYVDQDYLPDQNRGFGAICVTP